MTWPRRDRQPVGKKPTGSAPFYTPQWKPKQKDWNFTNDIFSSEADGYAFIRISLNFVSGAVALSRRVTRKLVYLRVTLRDSERAESTSLWMRMFDHQAWVRKWLQPRKTSMMTSSNGNIFRVTGPLCGEFTGHRWIPSQRPVTRSFDVFSDLRPNKRSSREAGDWRHHRDHYDVTVMREIYNFGIHVIYAGV